MNSHEVSYILTHSSRTLTHSHTLYQVWITIGRESSRDRLRMACSRTLTKTGSVMMSRPHARSRTSHTLACFGLDCELYSRECVRSSGGRRAHASSRNVALGARVGVRRVLWGFLGQLWGSRLGLWNTCWEPFGVANWCPDEVQVCYTKGLDVRIVIHKGLDVRSVIH
jgi:hypothetical protein